MENGSAAYYWRDDRDIIAVVDKAGGYVWKTGADVGFSRDINAAVKAAQTDGERLAAAEPIEKSMNATYVGVANSLLTVEYRDGKNFFIGSAAQEGSHSTLSPMPGEPGRYVLACDFTEIDLKLNVYVTLLDAGLRYDIPHAEITGAGRAVLTALWLTPFLGASGGEAEFYDPATGDYGDAVPKTAIPGYALVPDGSGVLIRFQNNTVPFVEYVGDVYGPDLATETYSYLYDTDALDLKNPVMPVFGIAHGNRQAAFVAWADSGAEFMDVVMRPEENLRLKYNFCYPRFEYNVEYYRVYNRKGEGYFTMGENLFECDVSMTYQFLHGGGEDGTPPADYAGMAWAYRRHLAEKGILREGRPAAGDIPIRLDFILSDMKRGLIGPEQVVVTTAGDVRDIISQVSALGITNVSGGLTGWQAGASQAVPDAFRFTSRVGTEADFRSLVQDMNEAGADLSFARDYTLIHEKMLRYAGTASRHLNKWYVYHNRFALYEHAPVAEFSYAQIPIAARWMENVAQRAAPFSRSLTVSGLTQTLISSYDYAGMTVSLAQGREAARAAAARAKELGLKLDMETPNLYLWEYADRFLQCPVGGSQYVFQTDDVPFLQMVLRGAMEVYGPYSNFSFYTREDVLRMIDYNISPSFVLSKRPSYLLTDTLSSDLYSTEFEQYRELIASIYGDVNAVLSQVAGYDWVGRSVPQNGVVVNEYGNGGAKAFIAVNYTGNTITYLNREVAPQSAAVIQEAAP